MSDMKENYSEMTSFSDHDLDCIINMILETKDILENKAIMDLVRARAKKADSKVKSIQDLKDIYVGVTKQANEDKTNGVENKKVQFRKSKA